MASAAGLRPPLMLIWRAASISRGRAASCRGGPGGDEGGFARIVLHVDVGPLLLGAVASHRARGHPGVVVADEEAGLLRQRQDRLEAPVELPRVAPWEVGAVVPLSGTISVSWTKAASPAR